MIITTIVLYYELYVGGAVATKISADLDMSLAYLILVSIVGNVLGALASIFAGLADRWGRANLVVYGLAITGVLIYAISFVETKLNYLILFAGVSLVEGVILVATPALVRDFSPQLGRASAMGFWTLGPVVGSLVVTEVSSNTLDAHPDWQYQFQICGIVGMAVFVIAFLGLRELAPQLRDQLMVSLRDRTLIEAKARGIDPEKALQGHWRQMLKWDIIGSSFAIGVFLLFYYIAVGLWVVFFATNYGYTEAEANALANWYWASNAIALIVAGLLSDWLKVRKPFMLLGALVSAAGVTLFALATTKPETDNNTWIQYTLMISIGGAFAFATWMAAFTETVEKRNPAATATGLAVWGATLRLIVVVAFAGLIYAIPAASTLVDSGQKVQALAAGTAADLNESQNAIVKAVAADPSIATKAQTLAAKYTKELATAAKMKPATQAALTANPTDVAAQAQAITEISGKPVADVAKAITLGTKYKDELATAATMSQATQQALLLNPTDPATQAKAVGEIATGLKIPADQAALKLAALAAVPTADLLFMATNAPGIIQASEDLTALSKVPAADLAFLAKYGPPLQDAKVVEKLTYLAAEGPVVQQALKDSPAQWQRWWWICLAGQILFIPFVWLLTGRWSPRKARQDAKAHEQAVDQELAALAGEQPAATATT